MRRRRSPRERRPLSALYQDEDFGGLYPTRGQLGLPPWRLALFTVFEFSEQQSDRQAADTVRARIDWKYALGLELTEPGFHFSALTEFRARLIAGDAEHLLLDRMLTRFRARGLVKVRGKQRTDSTHVLAAVAPGWLRGITQPVWFKHYGRRVEGYRPPKGRAEREALPLAIGVHGFCLLEALDAPDAPAEARGVSMVSTLRDVWRVHYAREGGGTLHWRSGPELPPVGERLQSPSDPEVCDPDVAHLVTNVMTCPAMQPEMASTAAIHEQLAAKDLLPAEHFVDAGYVDAGLLVGSRRDRAVALEGPVRAMPQRATKAERACEQRHFVMDWKHERVTCPQGKTPATWRAIHDEVGAPRVQAVFSRTDCGACLARRLCTSSKRGAALSTSCHAWNTRC
ncbi:MULTISPECIES: transposase [Methylobacterium]|uniref:transposase n=1 Tax=Methylobacterium TaxID=407 RepID=UPI0016506754|nr:MULTISPECIES: transposase [Methylobacterium]